MELGTKLKTLANWATRKYAIPNMQREICDVNSCTFNVNRVYANRRELFIGLNKMIIVSRFNANVNAI